MRMRLEKGTLEKKFFFPSLSYFFFLSKKYNDQPSERGRKKVREKYEAFRKYFDLFFCFLLFVLIFYFVDEYLLVVLS